MRLATARGRMSACRLQSAPKNLKIVMKDGGVQKRALSIGAARIILANRRSEISTPWQGRIGVRRCRPLVCRGGGALGESLARSLASLACSLSALRLFVSGFFTAQTEGGRPVQPATRVVRILLLTTRCQVDSLKKINFLAKGRGSAPCSRQVILPLLVAGGIRRTDGSVCGEFAPAIERAACGFFRGSDIPRRKTWG
jgi:hypothetical protein